MQKRKDMGWKFWTDEVAKKRQITWEKKVENGYVSPNKGRPLNIDKEERERRKEFLKSNNPMRNPESRKQLSNSTKGVSKPCHYNVEERQKRSKKWKENNPMDIKEIRQKVIGENHYNFDIEFYQEHGIWRSHYPYNENFNSKTKRWVLKLYNYKCVVTGITNDEHKRLYGRSLIIHHWNYDKSNSDMYWLVPVCSEINAFANHDRESWMAFFGGIVEEKMNSIKMLG